MPGEKFRGRAVIKSLGRVNFFAMKSVIILAVFEFLFNAAADFDMELGSYGHVTGIKEPVHIASQWKW